jgi:hypothetical protein
LTVQNLRRDIQNAFTTINRRMRSELEARYNHTVIWDVSKVAEGFKRASSKIGIPKSINNIANWKSATTKALNTFVIGGGSGKTTRMMGTRTVQTLEPGKIFKREGRGASLKFRGIPNANVRTDGKNFIVDYTAPGANQENLLSNINKAVRKAIWDTFLRAHGLTKSDGTAQAGLGFERNSAIIGKHTNFGHDNLSTVSLQSMKRLEGGTQAGSNEYDADVDQKFNDINKKFADIGVTLHTKDMFEYVMEEILKDVDITSVDEFDANNLNQDFSKTIEGRIDPHNKFGSEKSDKSRAFITKFYKKELDKAIRAGKLKSLSPKEAAEFKASESFNQSRKRLLALVVAGQMRNNSRMKVESKFKKTKHSQTKKVKAKTSTRKGRVSTKTLVAKGASVAYGARVTKSNIGLSTIMSQLNASLPRHLKRNMEPPALQYRGRGNPRQGTGPFNTGVRVTSVTPHKKVRGGLNINYTYEKYPYQTFEPGFKQGSTLRDPRKLIEESVRDVMIERKRTQFLNFRRY